MTNKALLKETINNSGITITHIAESLGCSRNRVYAIMDGSECSASEIIKLTELLHLTKPQRDAIFLSSSVIVSNGEEA